VDARPRGAGDGGARLIQVTPLLRVVLNEQTPFTTPDGGHGLTVNSVHITVSGLLDLVVSSATSDVHGCG
jgi:hypothetical protein